MIRALGLAVALVAGLAGAQGVPEPDGYRLNAFRAPVPATLAGAEVVDTAGAHALWASGEAVFVDVFPRPPRPANLPEGTLWIDPKRTTIEGAVWLPNTGYGQLTPDTEAYLARQLSRLTENDRGRTVVFFCLADCWMSWNAARRAVLELGYRSVVWYPEGTDGWDAAGHPLETVEATLD